MSRIGKRPVPVPTGVTANCLHPGAVATDIWSGAPLFARPVLAVAKRFMRTPADGGARITYLATDAAVNGATGGYYDDDRVKPPRPLRPGMAGARPAAR